MKMFLYIFVTQTVGQFASFHRYMGVQESMPVRKNIYDFTGIHFHI